MGSKIGSVWATPLKRFEDKFEPVTEERVMEMRRRYSHGDISQTELGREFGIGKSMANYILSGKNWTHV